MASLPHFRSALLASFIWLTFFHNANCFILFCKFLYLILCHIRQVKLNITPKSISLKAREKLFWNTERYITILPFCLWTSIRVGFYPKHFLIYNKLTFFSVYKFVFFELTILFCEETHRTLEQRPSQAAWFLPLAPLCLEAWEAQEVETAQAWVITT